MKDLRLSLLAGALLGLAVLIKGLSIFPFVLVFLMITLFEKASLRLFIAAGVIGAAIVLPVYALFYLNFGDAFVKMYFFGKSHPAREVSYRVSFWRATLLCQRDLARVWTMASTTGDRSKHDSPYLFLRNGSHF
ncbi:MAG: hypothetical protein UZ21_OP11001000176 [Microgenomates bacterium OLB22]|nr:MAG: hypothetical protein UZ21_OP11001000176 [Microgenomates bacterium OLB22]